MYNCIILSGFGRDDGTMGSFSEEAYAYWLNAGNLLKRVSVSIRLSYIKDFLKEKREFFVTEFVVWHLTIYVKNGAYIGGIST